MSQARLPSGEQGYVVLQLATKGIEAIGTSTTGTNLVSLNIGDSDLDWLNVSSELIIGTVHETLVFAGALSRLAVRIASAKAERTQLIVWSIVKAAQLEKVQTAPACLRPGSFLVQASSARSDERWRALTRLRYLLRSVGEARVVGLMAQPRAPTTESMLRTCVTVFNEWRSEYYASSDKQTRELPLLPSVFPNMAISQTPVTASDPLSPPSAIPRTTSSASATSSSALSEILLEILSRPSSLIFETGCLSVRHQDHLGPNSIAGLLSLGPYAMSARLWLSQTPPTSDRDSFGSILHFALQSSLGQGKAEITPALLLVIRHIVKVRHVFEAKMIVLEQATKTSKSSTPTTTPSTISVDPVGLLQTLRCHRVVFEACLAFEQASIDLEVRDLAINLTSQSGLVAGSFGFDLPRSGTKSPSPLPPGLEASLILRLDKLRVSALEVISRVDQPNDRRTLVALDVSGADSRISLLAVKGPNPIAGRVSAVVAIEELRSSAPANVARLFAFAQRWKEKTFP